MMENYHKKNINAVAMGQIKSERKAITSKENGINWSKPHFKKCRYFEKVYPYPLESNEWKKKFPVGKTKTGRVATYNPDYYCKTTKNFIEVTTSIPNIIEQGEKWRKVIRDGVRLKVYWWEGFDITKGILNNESCGDMIENARLQKRVGVK